MRRLMAVVLTFTLVACFPARAMAVQVIDLTPAVLASADAELDGATVRFTGEVVSEQLRADDTHVWLNILGDGVAIGVYLPVETAEKVTTFGDYEHVGDTVEIVGVFAEACDEHGGDMDVHATMLELVEPGSERERTPQVWKGVVGVAGLLLAFLQTRRFRRMRDEVVS